MTSLSPVSRLRAVFGVLAMLLPGMHLFGEEVARPSEAAQRAAREMADARGAMIDTKYSRLTGLVTFMTAGPGKGVPVPDAAAVSPEDRATSFLRTYGSAFGFGAESEARVTQVIATDVIGVEHVRVQQLFKGVPVVAGEVMVHLRGGDVVAANGKALEDLALDTVPSIDPERALEAVRDLARKHLGAESVDLTVPELQILNRGMLEGVRRPTHLTWFVVAMNESLREYVWVDAHRGGVVLHFSQRPDARNRTVYNSNNSATLPGALMRSEGGAATGDNDADAAYTYAGDTYDYFWAQHGRDSYDDAGGELRSSVRYCETTCPYANAFWNGTQMVYGAGLSAADDVVAHELTHAVTERSAGLFYYMQSGALNESFSDIFGETVDQTNTGGTDTPAVKWLMGEDVPGFGAARNMMNPPAFSDPGRVSDSAYFYCGGVGGNTDGGGVHTNSGVPNHAYALMTDGGTYNGQTIVGIGLTKAAKIQYRALTTYLLSGSDFLDDYYAINQSCTDLIGTAGITPSDCTEVGKALAAVELSQAWPCPPAQSAVPAFCPAGQTVVDVWTDDFENTASGRWSTSLLSGTYNHWNVTVTGWRAGTGDSSLYFSDSATSGTHHLWAYDHAYVGAASAQMASGVTLPAGARLQFNHSFGFDNYNAIVYDGGVVEYCTGACSTWNDAGSLISAGAGYNGTISSALGNPLGGRSAFTRESWGYTASQLDLSSLAGQGARFRFRIGTDSSVDDYGWFIDDVRIYQCIGAHPPTVTGFTPTSGPVGTQVGLAGTDFTGATAVLFNGTAAATYTVHSPTSITATVPSGATAGPISVTTPDGTGTSSGSFIVSVPGQPSISISDVSVVEGNSGTTTATMTVSLSAASTNTVSVNYGTADGTATADAAPLPGPWAGSTGQGLGFSFTVGPSGTQINPLSFATSFSCPGFGSPFTQTFRVDIGISNGQFFYADTPGKCPSTSFAGQFGSATSASGSVTLTFTGSAIPPTCGCSGTLGPLPWAATLVPAVSGDITGAGKGHFDAASAGRRVVEDGAAGGDADSPLLLNARTETAPSVGALTLAPTAVEQRKGTAPFGEGIIANLTGNADYVASLGALNFPPGTTSKTISVSIGGDTALEPDETFFVYLSDATNAFIADPQGVGTILSDDSPAPALSINDVAVTEGNSGVTTATFTVSLSAASGQTVSVNYATANGTATSGSDYVAFSGTVTFPPGSATQNVSVTVNGDTTGEPNETFFVNLSSPTNATIADAQGTGTITNDDLPALSISDLTVPEGDSGTTAATFTVSLSAASAQTVTVNYATANGTATSGSDYLAAAGTVTFPAGSTTQSVSVTINGDAAVEPNETFLVNLSGPTNATIADAQGVGTISNDDSPSLSINDVAAIEGNSGTTTATFTISLSAASSQTVTASYATANGTATSGSDYLATAGTVTFPAGSTTQSVAVTVNGDVTVEPNETFLVNLSGPTNATIADAQGVGTITNDDSPSLSINDVAVAEGNSGTTIATLTVSLSAASSQTVTASYATADGTATSGSDYLATVGTVTFPAGSTTQSVAVTVNGDVAVEPNETFVVNLSGPTNATIADAQGTGTITNDDIAVSPATSFYTLTPCRLVDTRDPAGPLGGPSLQPGAQRTFALAGAKCAIPSTASAVSVNLTVTEPAAPGNVRLFPAGVPVPLVSTLNFVAGQTRANNAIVQLGGGTTGSIVVLNGAAGTVHFILDVNGYFE